MKLCNDQIQTVNNYTAFHFGEVPLCRGLTSPHLIHTRPACLHLFVVDVDGNPLAQHQLHGGGVAELHRGFDDQVNAFVRGRDAVEVHRVVDG